MRSAGQIFSIPTTEAQRKKNLGKSILSSLAEKCTPRKKYTPLKSAMQATSFYLLLKFYIKKEKKSSTKSKIAKLSYFFSYYFNNSRRASLCIFADSDFGGSFLYV